MKEKTTIGSRIAKARKDKGITQAEVAEKLNVSFQAVSSWERDEFIPEVWNLIELAKVLDVSVSSLVEDRNGTTFKTTKNIYDWKHMFTFIKTTAKAYQMKDTLKALDFAVKAHEGQTKKKSNIPFVYHPLNLACHCLAMDIREDSVIAACLLHDVVEDTEYTLDDLPVGEETKQLVRLMTHEKTDESNYDEVREKHGQAYDRG